MPLPSLQPPCCISSSPYIITFIIILTFLTTCVTSKTPDAVCLPSVGVVGDEHNHQNRSVGSPCPPFQSSTSLPFPFSTRQGCGHPSFQITCSTPHSLISINNLTFSLLHFDLNSSSLLLSPHNHHHILEQNTTCPALTEFPSIPPHSINLTGTPFRFSEESCSRLSILKPCDTAPSHLSNCSQCHWLCSIAKDPIQLFRNCNSRSNRAPISEQGCQADVLGFLDGFLQMGIQIDWDDDNNDTDSYFTDCNDCESKGGVCGFDSSDPHNPFLCSFQHTKTIPPWIRSHRKITVLASVITLLSILCILLFSLFLLLRRRRLIRSLLNPEDQTTLFLHRHRSASLLPPVFTYDELESSTNRFDQKRKIGDGGFGSVYLGQRPNGQIIAVKSLHINHRAGETSAGGGGGGGEQRAAAFSTKSFCNEILILSSIDHPNLVKLHGYCSDPRGLLLVYDYIPNGTLADHLHGQKSLYRNGYLTWPVRVEIALQIAMAIEYLHFSVQPPVVHRDITTSNIFVEKDLRVKLGDFGLSRLLVHPQQAGDGSGGGAATSPNIINPQSSVGSVWTGPQGTPGYLDPDYYRSFQLTEKSDVYSFGVVLMELVTGKKAVDGLREKREVALVDVVVPRIQTGLLGEAVDPLIGAVDENGRVVVEGVAAVAELAFRCVAMEKDDRPDAREVTAEMRRIWGRTRGVRPGGGNSNVVVVPQS